MSKSQYYNQSIKRAIKIMHLFTTKENELGLTDISKMTGIHKSIVYRILVTLESEGWLIKNPKTSKYMLGIRILSLSSVILEDLTVRRLALPVMEELSAITGETIVLAMSSNGGAICIEKIESNNSIKTTAEVGKYFPLHAGATGLAVLMGMPMERIKDILTQNTLKKYTDKTVTNPEKIVNRIKEAKQKGFIMSVGSVDPGVLAIGIPLNFEQENIFMGLSVTGPQYRFDEQKIYSTVNELKKAKSKILQVK